jgi:hypothetical protein
MSALILKQDAPPGHWGNSAIDYLNTCHGAGAAMRGEDGPMTRHVSAPCQRHAGIIGPRLELERQGPRRSFVRGLVTWRADDVPVGVPITVSACVSQRANP